MTQVWELLATEHDIIGEKRHFIRDQVAKGKMLQAANPFDLL